jgi:hypothetical protein
MARCAMKAVFLSASIPDPQRDPKYHGTSDEVLIRNAIDALVTVVLPRGLLVWGGHPAISPFVRRLAERMSVPDHVKTYQSEEFRAVVPADTQALPGIVWTPKGRDRKDSLAIMRRAMLSAHSLVAGVFIGGMEGVENEYDAFKAAVPGASAFPIASTGAAARILWQRFPQADATIQDRLEGDLGYDSLFEDILGPLLK